MDDILTYDAATGKWRDLMDEATRQPLPMKSWTELPQIPKNLLLPPPPKPDDFESILDMAMELMTSGKLFTADDLKEAYLAGYDKGQGDGYNGLGFNPEEDEYVRSVEILKPT